MALLGRALPADSVAMQHTPRAIDIMSHVELVADPATTVAQAWALMGETGVRVLPVVDNGCCLSIVTAASLIDVAAPGVPKDCELPLDQVSELPPLGVLPGDDLFLVLDELSARDDGVLVVADLQGAMLGIITCLDAVAAAARRLRPTWERIGDQTIRD